MIQAIKGWRDINSAGEESDSASASKRKNDRNDWNARGPRGRSYQVQQQASERQMRGCVYCDDVDHTSANCTKVVAVGDRRRFLRQKQLVTNTEQIAVEAVGATTVNANITRQFVITQQAVDL